MSGHSLLTALFNAGVAVLAAATVLSLGMSFTVAQVLAPLRRIVLMIVMIVVNCLLIPAAAWSLFTAFGLRAANVSGATLTAVGAAGAMGLKAAQMSRRADLPLAVSAVIVLQLLNLVAVPLWAAQVASGASISAVTILKDLLGLVTVPLAVGLFVRWRYADRAKRWQPHLVKIANFALGIALIAGIVVNRRTIVSLLVSRVLIASLTVVLVSLVAGYVVGGRAAQARVSTGLVSGMRFTALGLVIIGTQLHANPDYLGPAIMFVLVDMIVAVLVALALGLRARAIAHGSRSAASGTGGGRLVPAGMRWAAHCPEVPPDRAIGTWAGVKARVTFRHEMTEASREADDS